MNIVPEPLGQELLRIQPQGAGRARSQMEGRGLQFHQPGGPPWQVIKYTIELVKPKINESSIIQYSFEFSLQSIVDGISLEGQLFIYIRIQ